VNRFLIYCIFSTKAEEVDEISVSIVLLLAGGLRSPLDRRVGRQVQSILHPQERQAKEETLKTLLFKWKKSLPKPRNGAKKLPGSQLNNHYEGEQYFIYPWIKGNKLELLLKVTFNYMIS